MSNIKTNVKRADTMLLKELKYCLDENTAAVFTTFTEHHRKTRNRDLDFTTAE